MYELRRILVPTDFSKHAEEALEYALFLGERFHPEIVLLHVDEFAVSPLGAGEVRDEVVQQYQERKSAYLNDQFDTHPPGRGRARRSVWCRRSCPAVPTR